ncbi:MAG: PKD domain-containing protein [Thermoleophilaceae bacterium]|nr:PKD domain-containing protein [Thermoleophilaceae bacterium]
MRRRLLLLALTLAAFAILPSAASAANFCVGSVPTCLGSPEPNFSADATGITNAVAAANALSGEDTIFLAAGTYNLATPLNPTFAALQDVHIVGAGAGLTTFIGSVASAALLTLNFTTTGSDASGFTVNFTGTPSSGTGVQVFKGGLTDFAVAQPGGLASGFHALALDSGASAKRGSISLTSGSGVGIHLNSSGASGDDGAGTASEITMTGPGGGSSGILIDTNTAGVKSFDRMRITRFGRGVEVTTGSFKLTNSAIEMGSQNAAQGLDAYNGISNSDIFADVSRVTIVGTGPFQTALAIGAGAAGNQSFTGGFFDMVLYAAGETSNALICQGGTSVSLTATVNSYAAKGADLDLSGCSTTENNKTDLSATDPGFRDLAAGDFRLKPDSPLIDRGFAGEIISPSELDMIGRTRVVDGDGNGSAVVDLGAFEYQRTPPTLSVAASPQPAETLFPVEFTAVTADADGESSTVVWSFDDGERGGGSSAVHRFATPGLHTGTAVVTDESGLTATATTGVTILPLPTARIAAKATKAFKRGKKGFSVAKKGQRSFSVIFTGAAQAKFTLKRLKGRKLIGIKGSQTIKVSNGTVKIFFGGKKLKAGRYRVTITPLSPNDVAGKPVTTDIRLK